MPNSISSIIRKHKVVWTSGAIAVSVVLLMIVFQFLYSPLQGAAERPPLVLQSMNGKLDFFAGGSAVPIAWCYPALLQKSVAQAPIGAWVVIGTDKDGIPVGYTPECIQALEDRTMFDQIGQFVDNRPKSQWEQAIDTLTSRNRSGGWIIYRKHRAEMLSRDGCGLGRRWMQPDRVAS